LQASGRAYKSGNNTYKKSKAMKEQIAENIWKAIRASKLTLGEVAKGLGSKGALQNLKYILDGTGNPRLDTMIKLSEILQTPLSKFYENT
jgi:hypothetical protein